jgi:hypothetical protein
VRTRALVTSRHFAPVYASRVTVAFVPGSVLASLLALILIGEAARA